METHARKGPVPHPRTNWGRGFDAGQNFYGPAGGLDARVPLATVLPPLRGKGVGEAAPLRAQVGVHPPLGIHYVGGVRPGAGGLVRGAVEGLTVTRPIKPLGRVAPSTSSTTAPTGAPQVTPPSPAARFRTTLDAMGTGGPGPYLEVFAFIIRS